MSIAYILISKSIPLSEALNYMQSMSFRTDQMVEIDDGYKFVICYDDGKFMNKKVTVATGIDYFYFDYAKPMPKAPIPRQDNMDISPETFQKQQTRVQEKINTKRLKELYKGLVDYARIPTIAKTKKEMVKNAVQKAETLQKLEPEISTADVQFPQNVNFYISKVGEMLKEAELFPGANDPLTYTEGPYKRAKLPGEFGPEYQRPIVPASEEPIIEPEGPYKRAKLPGEFGPEYQIPIVPASEEPIIEPEIQETIEPAHELSESDEEAMYEVPKTRAEKKAEERARKRAIKKGKKLLSPEDAEALAEIMNKPSPDSEDEAVAESKPVSKVTPLPVGKPRKPESSASRARKTKGKGLFDEIKNTRYDASHLLA
jgi:hypothetical protein